MPDQPRPGQTGQANVEYAMLLVFVALIAVVALTALGSGLADRLEAVSTIIGPSSGSKNTSQVLQDLQSAIRDFYNSHGHWPRTWSPYNFTDLGLDPDDWNEPINGLYWSPHGSEVGIANKQGDNLQVYVKDLGGNTLHLYDGWSIWCPVNDAHCYYHTVAPGNEIDISTIFVVEQ